MALSTIRQTAAIAGVAGIAVLAGCSSTAATSTDAQSSGTPSESSRAATSSGTFVAGTYEAEGTYLNPRSSVQAITVSLTITADGTVDAVDVTSEATDGESKQYQSQFISGIADQVVGKSIDGLRVDKVSGSSLTSQGFNAAVEQIRTQAAG